MTKLSNAAKLSRQWGPPKRRVGRNAVAAGALRDIHCPIGQRQHVRQTLLCPTGFRQANTNCDTDRAGRSKGRSAATA